MKNILSYHNVLDKMTGELSNAMNKLKSEEKSRKDDKVGLEDDIVMLKKEKPKKVKQLEKVNKTLAAKGEEM